MPGLLAWLYDVSILLLEFTSTEQGKRIDESGVPWLPDPTEEIKKRRGDWTVHQPHLESISPDQF